MAYRGSCHCGAVVFEVDEDVPSEAFTCNCSHCRRKGFILSFVPDSAVKILQGAECMTEYRFNKRTLSHPFCSSCGCQPFGLLTKPTADGIKVVAVNLRLVPAIDLESLKITMKDSASQ